MGLDRRRGPLERRRGSTSRRGRNPDGAPARTTGVAGVGTASDEALLAGMAAGDGHAARTFVRRYQQRVFGLAVTIVSDRHAAEDIAQEAFLRAWRHAGGFDARRASAATWLLTITRNAAIDAIRLRRATPSDPATLVALALPASAEPDVDAVARTELDRVRAALQVIPEDQRRAVLLAAFVGLTAAEIATIEDIPLGTAKTRIRSGLGKLRNRLVQEVEP